MIHHIPCNFMYKSVIARIAQALLLRKNKFRDNSFNILIRLKKFELYQYFPRLYKCNRAVKQKMNAGQWVEER
ncbi:hypothetical protein PATA110616_15940 [Paenibacillus tarimensis]